MSEPYWSALGAAAVDYEGAWAAGTQYATGDVVVYNGVTYLAVNPSLGSTPPTLEELMGPGAPTGALLAFGGVAAPSGYLLCDGTAVSRGTYSALFAVIGTIYGAGDGSTTFNLPDLRGRSPVGLGTRAGWVDALGISDGTAVGNRSPQHRHSVNDPGHSHSTSLGGGSDGGPRTVESYNSTGGPVGTSVNGTGISVGPAGHPLVDYTPYLTVNFIIKT